MITPPAGKQSPTPTSVTLRREDPIAALAGAPIVYSKEEKSASFLVVNTGSGCPDFEELASTYKGKCIHTLVLHYADIRGATWHFLEKFLYGLTPLDTLDLSKVGFGTANPFNVNEFGKFLEKLRTMPARLLLRDNMIGSNVINRIAPWLSVDKRLKTLDLAENLLSAKDIQTLSNALSNNKTLQCLDLAKNQLDSSAIPALCDLLDRAGSLQSLDLSENLFTAEEKNNLLQRAAARTAGAVELKL